MRIFTTITLLIICFSIQANSLNDIRFADIFTSIDTSICSGDTLITPEDKKYFMAGTYIDTFALVSGCDSIRTLQLKLTPLTDEVIIEEYYCEGDPNISAPRTIPGQNCSGDTIINVIIYPLSPDFITNASICEGESFMVKGVLIDSTTQIICEEFDANGCPYLSILNLEVIQTPPDEISEVSICEGDSYFWNENGQEYSTAGSYTIKNPGCEAIQVLNLYLLAPIEVITIDTSICAGESYMGYSEAGDYTISELENNSCTALINLTLGILPAEDCISHTYNESLHSFFKIYPNPAKTYITIDNDLNDMAHLNIYNLLGQSIYQIQLFEGSNKLDLTSWTAGIYNLAISKNGQVWTHRILVTE